MTSNAPTSMTEMLGKNIRRLRRAKRLTMKQLGDACEITESYVALDGVALAIRDRGLSRAQD